MQKATNISSTFSKYCTGYYGFGFNGFEKDDEIKGNGNHLSFGDYGYDTRLGKRWTIDKHSNKYPFISPYSSFSNNPLIFSDPSGKDVVLMVWTTGDGVGHAAIAVSNYKIVGYKQDVYMGNVINIPIFEKDGSYTYYDLWPGLDYNGDGISDGIGEARIKEDLFSGPIAHYQIFKDYLLNDLTKKDPSKAEGGKSPDGVIKLYSGFNEDMETIEDIKSYMEKNKQYNFVRNNCSDFASCGVSEVLDKFKCMIEANSNESYFGFGFTTPNGLFKYVQEIIRNNSSEGIILKDPGTKVDVKFEDAIIEPRKQQQRN